MSYRNYCFTLNNPLENGGPSVCDWLEANAIFGVIGCETGENGTFHWQGYFELPNPMRHSTIKRMRLQWHVEPRRGTRAEAINYCKKDGNFVEFGSRPGQGRRTDLDRVRECALDEGMRGVTARYNLQQINTAAKFLTYNEEPREWRMDIFWISGASGAGKSRLAREIATARGYGDDIYVKNTPSKWWDGYDNHGAIIIDDFREDWMPLTDLLALLDRYELRIECKNGSRQIRARIVLITSPLDFDDVYNQGDECKYQLIRRVQTIVRLTSGEEREEQPQIIEYEDEYELGDNVLQM